MIEQLENMDKDQKELINAMSKKVKITITLDQPMLPATDELLRLYIRDGFSMISSYSPDNVLIEEVNAAEPREIGLNDKFGTPIISGCIVEATGTVNKWFTKGDKFKCVWNIRQHRYGFMHMAYEELDGEKMEDIIKNPSNLVDCHFYATPRNVKNLKVIG